LPISGLLTYSQNGKNRSFFQRELVAPGNIKLSWRTPVTRGTGVGRASRLSRSTIYWQTSTIPIASTIQPSPHVPFDPHLNYSRHLSSLSSIYYSESLFPIPYSRFCTPLALTFILLAFSR
jgi:hypothetical protein